MSNLEPGERLPWGTAACAFPDGPALCLHPATLHVHIGLSQDGAVQHTAACLCHAATAVQLPTLVDWHPFGGVCNMPDARWVHTDLRGPGSCVWVLEDGTDAAAAEPIRAATAAEIGAARQEGAHHAR